MKLKVGRYLLAFLMLSLFGLQSFAQPIRLMTYNIRLDVASDGLDAWEHRSAFLVSQIRFFEPDIFGIQEGLPHQVAYLEQNLVGYNREGEGREGHGKGEYSAIFYNRSKFTVQQRQTFWLSPTPDSVSMGWDAACLRVCTAVLLKENGSNRRFWVFNTHLDHIGEAARANGIALILSKMKTLNVENLPAVFMGDLNALPSSNIVNQLKIDLDDTRDRIGADALGPEGSFNGFKFGQSTLKLIDYIFVTRTPGLLVRKYAIIEQSRNGHYPSDHFPVFAEIEF